jgi:hypothetical protein
MEIWKSVKDYEGIYEVSNLGNVKRINSKTLGVNKKYCNGYILKPLDNGMGYLRVKLSKDNKSKRVLLHKIIAHAFIDNPDNKKTINHINGIKSDNRIENLEWCTQSENCKHAFVIGLSSFTENKRVAMLSNFNKRWCSNC